MEIVARMQLKTKVRLVARSACEDLRLAHSALCILQIACQSVVFELPIHAVHPGEHDRQANWEKSGDDEVTRPPRTFLTLKSATCESRMQSFQYIFMEAAMTKLPPPIRN